MSFKDTLKNKGLLIGGDVARIKEKRESQPARLPDERPLATVPGRMADLQDRKWLQLKVEELSAELEKTKTANTQAEIRLDDLHEVVGRKRKLTPQQFNELVENLRQHPLVTPITVRTRKQGGFEIVSGHNRVDAYRQLGRPSIAAWVLESDEEQAELNAFYANLLQPSLPEYEKYLGFRKRLQLTGKTQTEIAQEAGITASYVSLLMQFDELPTEIRHFLNDKPDLFGAHAAKEFASLVKNGKLEQVVKAIEGIALGQLNQAAAVRQASQNPSMALPKSSARKIRAGRAVFAEMRTADKTLRISFRTAEERAEVEAAIEEVLQSFADQAKS